MNEGCGRPSVNPGRTGLGRRCVGTGQVAGGGGWLAAPCLELAPHQSWKRPLAPRVCSSGSALDRSGMSLLRARFRLSSRPSRGLTSGGLSAIVVVALCLGAGTAWSDDAPQASSSDVSHPAEAEPPQRADAASRARSRVAYADQGPDQALETLRSRHPGLIQPAWRALDENRAPVDAYLGDFAARLDLGNGNHAVVDSLLPLRTSVGGSRRPVDLALRDEASHLTPTAPLVPVRFPKRLSDGIELPDIGVAFSPTHTSAGASATPVAGSAFWANAAGTDTDVVAMPLPWGFQVLGYLRSAASPEEVAFRMTLPPGAHAARDKKYGQIIITRAEEELARISPPVAYDADGVRISASYVLEGDMLTARVAHRGADAHYPVVLDPVVIEDQRHWHTNAGMDFAGWGSGQYNRVGYPDTRFNNGAGDWWMGRGLFTFDNDRVYLPGEWGYWQFSSPGSTSFIYQAEFHYVRTQDQNTCLKEGIWNPGTSTPDPEYSWCNAWLNYASHGLCAVPGCPTTGGNPGNYLRFRMVTAWYEQYRDQFSSFTGGAAVYLNDLTAPTTKLPTAGAPDGWLDEVTTRPVIEGNDTGLGLKQFKLSVPGQADRYRALPCAGHRHDRCPTGAIRADSAGTTGDDFAVNTGTLPEGITTLTARTADFSGNWSMPITWDLKVDHTSPQVDLYGSLAEADGRTVNYATPYQLRVSAKDGDASQPRAGVKSIEIRVDDVQQLYAEQACPAGSCGMERTWDFVPAAYAPGRHVIEVIVDDQSGHRTVRELTVEVAGEPGCGGCPAATDKNTGRDTTLRLTGTSHALARRQVAKLGDVNGDGRADLAIHAPPVWGANSTPTRARGAVYVVYGRAAASDLRPLATMPATIALGSASAPGFRIDSPAGYIRDFTGIGDVNGDGRADIAVSVPEATFNGRNESGAVYVVFGKAGSTNVDLSTLGSGGYRIDGAAAGNHAGESVSRLDDTDGDGRPELVIGVPRAAPLGRAQAGSVYVVFGKPTTSTVDLASVGASGYRIDGPPAPADAYSGGIGSAVAGGGDFNGDGKSDILLGARTQREDRPEAGSAYVVYGDGGTQSVDLASLGARGYRIDGAFARDYFGGAVATVGDLNQDGAEELAVSAPYARFGYRGGSVYVVFGRPRGGTLDVRALGAEGYRIDGAGTELGKFDFSEDSPGGHIGTDIAPLRDVNGDGIPELGIATADGGIDIVYGRTDPGRVDLSLRTFAGYRITGTWYYPTLADAEQFVGDGEAYVAIADAHQPAGPRVDLVSTRPRLP